MTKKYVACWLISLMLWGCCGDESNKNTKRNGPVTYPDFALDQEVQIVSGFYRGHSGKITAYTQCQDRDTHDTTICYTIKNIDGAEYLVNQKDMREP